MCDRVNRGLSDSLHVRFGLRAPPAPIYYIVPDVLIYRSNLHGCGRVHITTRCAYGRSVRVRSARAKFAVVVRTGVHRPRALPPVILAGEDGHRARGDAQASRARIAVERQPREGSKSAREIYGGVGGGGHGRVPEKRAETYAFDATTMFRRTRDEPRRQNWRGAPRRFNCTETENKNRPKPRLCCPRSGGRSCGRKSTKRLRNAITVRRCFSRARARMTPRRCDAFFFGTVVLASTEWRNTYPLTVSACRVLFA